MEEIDRPISRKSGDFREMRIECSNCSKEYYCGLRRLKNVNVFLCNNYEARDFSFRITILIDREKSLREAIGVFQNAISENKMRQERLMEYISRCEASLKEVQAEIEILKKGEGNESSI